MGTDRKLNKMSMTRPRKTVAERRRRMKAQKRRLMDLGVQQKDLEKLTAKELRALLKHPKKIEAAYAG